MVKIESLIGSGKTSRLFKISPQGLALRVKSGKVPCVTIDGRKFFDRRVVERMAAKQEAVQ